MDYDELPRNCNLIGPDLGFKNKNDEKNSQTLKARLVLHGNKDRDRLNVRRDSASADLSTPRLVLPLAVILDMDVVAADVKEAYT